MRTWLMTLLLAMVAPSAAANMLVSVTSPRIAAGQFRSMWIVAGWPIYSGEFATVETTSSAPAVVSVSPVAMQTVYTYDPYRYALMTFTMAGYAVGDAVVDIVYAGKYTYRFYVQVEPCDHFPKVPLLADWVRGKVGELSFVFTNIETADDNATFEWYAGFPGDFSSGILGTEKTFRFTPLEPRQYHFWYRAIDKCGIGTGEATIDAAPPPSPRRRSVK